MHGSELTKIRPKNGWVGEGMEGGEGVVFDLFFFKIKKIG